MKPEDVESRWSVGVHSLRALIEDDSGPLRSAVRKLVKDAQAEDAGCATKPYIDAKWETHLRKQDDVGVRDYALHSLGASVVDKFTTLVYTPPTSFLSTGFKKKWGAGNSIGGPIEAISKGRNRGECFAFNGQVRL